MKVKILRKNSSMRFSVFMKIIKTGLLACLVIAKVAYEWHCYINDVEEYQEEAYGLITSYIIEPEQSNTLVSVVNDAYVTMLADRFSRTGSNMLFEYNDSDGNVYVIFCLWNVIAYKVKVGMHNEKPSMVHCPIAYFYHADGSQNGTMFGVYGDFHVNAAPPNVGVSELYLEIKSRLSKLGERDLSREYLQNCIAKISKKLPSYQEHKISIADLLDFEHEDRIIPVYIIEQIYTHRDEYVYLVSRAGRFADKCDVCCCSIIDSFTMDHMTKIIVIKRTLNLFADVTCHRSHLFLFMQLKQTFLAQLLVILIRVNLVCVDIFLAPVTDMDSDVTIGTGISPTGKSAISLLNRVGEIVLRTLDCVLVYLIGCVLNHIAYTIRRFLSKYAANSSDG